MVHLPETAPGLCSAGGTTDRLSDAALLLHPVPSSASLARRFAKKTLLSWGCREHIEATTLLVSELVTNSVLHARSTIQLRIERRDQALRVEVSDGSRLPPVQREHDADALTGRGLSLLESLASRWGVEDLPDGKAVWFELAV
jgi:anti-sigma regulatory factor (Ser/Thr protein kinase)